MIWETGSMELRFPWAFQHRGFHAYTGVSPRNRENGHPEQKYPRKRFRASLVAQMVKHLPAMQETWVRFLGWEDPLEKEMAIHSSTLAWKIPWTEEPERTQSTDSQRVGHDWANLFKLKKKKRKEICLFKKFLFVELQCCVNYCCTAKWLSYTYIHLYIFLWSFSIMVYHRILKIVPCATQ